MASQSFEKLGFKKKNFHNRPDMARLLNATCFKIQRELAEDNKRSENARSPTVGCGVEDNNPDKMTIGSDVEFEDFLSHAITSENAGADMLKRTLESERILTRIKDAKENNPDKCPGEIFSFEELLEKTKDKHFSFATYFSQFARKSDNKMFVDSWDPDTSSTSSSSSSNSSLSSGSTAPKYDFIDPMRKMSTKDLREELVASNENVDLQNSEITSLHDQIHNLQINLTNSRDKTGALALTLSAIAAVMKKALEVNETPEVKYRMTDVNFFYPQTDEFAKIFRLDRPPNVFSSPESTCDCRKCRIANVCSITQCLIRTNMEINKCPISWFLPGSNINGRVYDSADEDQIDISEILSINTPTDEKTEADRFKVSFDSSSPKKERTVSFSRVNSMTDVSCTKTQRSTGPPKVLVFAEKYKDASFILEDMSTMSAKISKLESSECESDQLDAKNIRKLFECNGVMLA